MEYLQVQDPQMRRAMEEFQAPQPAAIFGIRGDAGDVILRMADGHFILSAQNQNGAEDIETYAMPVRLPALMADLNWFFTQRSERANSEIDLGNGYRLHPHAFRLAQVENMVALTGREVALIAFIAKNGECTKEILLSEVWRYHPDSDTHTVETHLWRLRQKLAQAGMTAPLIATTDKGYRLA